MFENRTPLVFFGSDQIAANTIKNLSKQSIQPQLIVTSEDKPVGRKQTVTPPPPKKQAELAGIKVHQPPKLKGKHLETTQSLLKSYRDGIFVVVSYGQILPSEIIDLPRFGCLNLHFSLLPRWRGPAPMTNTILYDHSAGLSVIKMDTQMDHGPILSSQEITATPWPPSITQLREELTREGGRLLATTIHKWLNGQITPQEQDHSRATYCRKITKKDAELDPSDEPAFNYRKILAYQEWPRPHFFINYQGKRMRIIVTEAELTPQKELLIKRIIPEGKKEMDWQEFKQRYPLIDSPFS